MPVVLVAVVRHAGRARLDFELGRVPVHVLRLRADHAEDGHPGAVVGFPPERPDLHLAGLGRAASAFPLLILGNRVDELPAFVPLPVRPELAALCRPLRRGHRPSPVRVFVARHPHLNTPRAGVKRNFLIPAGNFPAYKIRAQGESHRTEPTAAPFRSRFSIPAAA